MSAAAWSAVAAAAADGTSTQGRVVELYATAILSDGGPKLEVPEIRTANEAIVARWGTRGRDRVKREAWKVVEVRATEERIRKMLASPVGESWTVPAGRLVRTETGWELHVKTPRDVARIMMDGTIINFESLGFSPIVGVLEA